MRREVEKIKERNNIRGNEVEKHIRIEEKGERCEKIKKVI